MSDLPSMPLYVDDYEAATAHLTFEEDGAYTRLLRLCWRASDCTLPDDDEWVMRRLRADKKTMKRLILPIISEFFSRENGRIFQKKQQKIHADVTERVNKKRAAGALGGKAKSLNSNDILPSTTSVLSEAKEPVCSSNTKSKLKSKSKSTNVEESPQSPPGGVFDDFWNSYPRKISKGAALKAWKAAIKKTSPESLLAAVTAHGEHWRTEKTESEFIPHPATWLNGERWSDSLENPKIAQELKPEAGEMPTNPLLASLAAEIGWPAYKSWFGKAIVETDGDRARLLMPTRFAVDSVKSKFQQFIEAAGLAAGYSGVDVAQQGRAA